MAVSTNDLKEVSLFRDLPEGMLEKLASIAERRLYQEGDLVYRKGESSDAFYALRSGKVLLQKEVSPFATISFASIKPGYVFEWSGLFRGSLHESNARCCGPCDVLAIGTAGFLQLLEEDHRMGHWVLKGIAKILQERLDYRTNQLLKVLGQHPDLERLVPAEE